MLTVRGVLEHNVGSPESFQFWSVPTAFRIEQHIEQQPQAIGIGADMEGILESTWYSHINSDKKLATSFNIHVLLHAFSATGSLDRLPLLFILDFDVDKVVIVEKAGILYPVSTLFLNKW